MKYLKFYKPSWPKDIAYMMQNVEYDAADFLRWLKYDFIKGGLPNLVEFKFKMTSHAKKIISLARLACIFWIVLALVVILVGWPKYSLVGLLMFLFYPFLAALNIAVIVWLLGKRSIKNRDQIYVKNIAKKLAKHPAIVVAVAGSYGKSTMRDTLTTVLSAGKKVATQPENHNTPVGTSNFVDSLEGDEDILVIEIGEYVPGDVKRLAEVIKPDIGIITGINEQHMIRMKSKQNTIKTIYELADFVDPQSLFVNGQSDWALEGSSNMNPKYSLQGAGNWKASQIKTDLAGIRFELKNGQKTISVDSPLMGQHQVGPLSAMAAVASRLGLTNKQIEQGIASTRQFARRFELKQWAGGVAVIDDTYNGNKDGFVVAIDFLNQLKVNGKRIYVTPGIIELGDKAEEVHKFIGKKLATSEIEQIYLIKNRLTDVVYDSFKQTNGSAKLDMIDDQQQFIINLENYASSDDVVFLQNSQHEYFFYS